MTGTASGTTASTRPRRREPGRVVHLRALRPRSVTNAATPSFMASSRRASDQDYPSVSVPRLSAPARRVGYTVSPCRLFAQRPPVILIHRNPSTSFGGDDSGRPSSSGKSLTEADSRRARPSRAVAESCSSLTYAAPWPGLPNASRIVSSHGTNARGLIAYIAFAGTRHRAPTNVRRPRRCPPP